MFEIVHRIVTGGTENEADYQLAESVVSGVDEADRAVEAAAKKHENSGHNDEYGYWWGRSPNEPSIEHRYFKRQLL